MASASEYQELEKSLLEVASGLSELPTEVEDLLTLVNRVGALLSQVEQSPPEPIKNAYTPCMKSLLDESILKHSDADVRVAVASCISDITRITAPDAPFDDDKMKDVLQLIVSSFENMSDKSSRSYNKQASILETVCKIKTCVIMLDLECEGLIVQMFQTFLNTIRDYHPEKVFTCMETIMTEVLEESEDISLELLAPILASVKRGNEEIPPISRKLGEKVLQNCAGKVRYYLKQALKSLNAELDDYSDVVSSVCQGRTISGEPSAEESILKSPEEKLHSPDEAAKADESKSTMASVDQLAQEAKESVPEEARLEDVHPEAERSNGMPDKGEIDTKPSDADFENKVEGDDVDTGKSATKDAENLIANKDASEDQQLDGVPSEENKKTNASLNPVPEKVADGLTDYEKKEDNLNEEDVTVKVADGTVNSDSGEKHEKLAAEVKPADDGSDSEDKPPSQSGKNEGNLVNDEAVGPVPETIAADEASDSDVKPKRHSVKKAKRTKRKRTPGKIVGKTSESEAKPKIDTVEAKPKIDTDGGSGSEDRPPSQSGKNKENLGNETSVLDIRPKRRAPGKIAKGKQTGGKTVGRTSESEAADGSSDSEEKPPSQSGKNEEDLGKDETSDLELKTRRQQGLGKMIGKRKRTPSKSVGESSDLEARPVRKCSTKKGDTSELEAKPVKLSGKKGETIQGRGRSKKRSGRKQSGGKKDDDTSDSETKLLTKQSDKKGGDTSDSETELSKESGKNKEVTSNKGKGSSKKDAGNRWGQGKGIRGKYLSKRSVADDDDEEMISSPESDEREDSLEEQLKTASKRKRTPGKDKISGKIEYGANLVGSKIKVWWPKDREFYGGVIDSFDPKKKKHTVLYEDGDKEILFLPKEKWEFIEDEEDNEVSTPTSSAKMHTRKKAKVTELRKEETASTLTETRSKSTTSASGSRSGKKRRRT